MRGPDLAALRARVRDETAKLIREAGAEGDAGAIEQVAGALRRRGPDSQGAVYHQMLLDELEMRANYVRGLVAWDAPDDEAEEP